MDSTRFDFFISDQTPLMLAAYKQDISACELLIENGADPDIKGGYDNEDNENYKRSLKLRLQDMTALEFALRHNNFWSDTDTVKYLRSVTTVELTGTWR